MFVGSRGCCSFCLWLVAWRPAVVSARLGVINRQAFIIVAAIIIVIMCNTCIDSCACQNVARCLTVTSLVYVFVSRFLCACVCVAVAM